MVDPVIFEQRIDVVRVKLCSHLGVRGKTLKRVLRRAGRSLPKPAREAGARLVDMQGLIASPRLRRLVAHPQVNAALDELNIPLDGIGVKQRRKDRLLGLTGSIVFNLMAVGTLVVAALRWRGLI